jgi:EAL domain-containing protein (putative c-di-GMP-specific phosphodiesterase class I)
MTMTILELALADARRWADAGLELPVSVNVSVRNLVDPDLPMQVDYLLNRFGVESERLQLEITESTVMSDQRRGHETLERLRAMGIRLSIDDFGTGYSSLAYLKGLPVHELKIDRGFVMNMTTDQADAFIVRCAVDLGRDLGLQVIAEGVEDEATLEALSALGCHGAQGYFFSRPVPAPELTAWLAERSEAQPLA